MTEVIGVAIVGRNAIAGPVCAAAVTLPVDDPLKFLQPVKSTSREDLRKLSSYIKNKAPFISIGWGSIAEIYTNGVDRAIYIAVSHTLKFVSQFDPKDFIILDSYKFPRLPNNVSAAKTPLLSIERAHEFIEPVIAAQIVATVARNAMMLSYCEEFPEYDWENNLGYATPMHIEAVRMHGYTSCHRPLGMVKSLRGERLFMHYKLRERLEDVRIHSS